MSTPVFRIFVSSPGDVVEERTLAERVIARLRSTWADVLTIESFLWEHEPLRATATYQEEIDRILRPSEADVVVCLFWHRFGSRLPPDIRRPDGRPFSSGTEYELEDALAGYARTGDRPALLVYRKTTRLAVYLDDPAYAERGQQRAELEAYLSKWALYPDGTAKRSIHPFESADDFETLLEQHLDKLVRERVQSLGSAPRLKPSWTNPPYRGLAAFEQEHAPIFFGRTRAISDIVHALRTRDAQGEGFVAVVGASGCGKSSLVRAGVLPLLAAHPVIPGVGFAREAVATLGHSSTDPFDVLASALASARGLFELVSEGRTVNELAALLREGPEATKGAVHGALLQAAASLQRERQLLALPKGRLVLIVDQMEQLFSAEQTTLTVQRAFVEILAALARGGHALVLATLRSDFAGRCADLPTLATLMQSSGRYDLHPPRAVDIERIIALPSSMAGLRFDPATELVPALNQRLRDAALAHPHSLPLLEFALDQLYERRTPDGRLTHTAYDEMGGLEGAIAGHAERAFQRWVGSLQGASPDREKQAAAALAGLLRGLVTISPDTGEVTARRAMVDSLSSGAGSALTKALVAARLLVMDTHSDGPSFVAVAHEALLKQWPRVREAIARDVDFLAVRARVASSTEEWRRSSPGSAHGRDPELLLPEGRRLAEAEDMIGQNQSDVDPAIAEYVAASRARSDRGRRRDRARNRIALSTFATLALVAFGGWLTARHAALRTQDTLASSEFLIAARDVGEARSDIALARLAHALRLSAGHSGAGQLAISLLLGAVPPHTWLQHDNGVVSAAFSPDGTRVLTASSDGTARIWSTETGQPVGAAMRHGTGVLSAFFSPDGTRVVTTAYDDFSAHVWDAATGTPIGPPLMTGGEAAWACFSPNGLQILTASRIDYYKGVRVWDAATGLELGHRFCQGTGVFAVSYDPTGRRVVTLSQDGSATLWDAATGKSLGSAFRHNRSQWSVAFSRDGGRLVTASDDGSASLRDATSGSPLGLPLRHEGPINSVSFSPDGTRVATASSDRTVRIWDATTGQPVGPPLRHEDSVQLVSFNPDGTEVIAASGLLAQAWDLASGDRVGPPLRHEDTVTAARFSSDGTRVITASRDKTARLWAAPTAQPLEHVFRHERYVWSAWFNIDGTRLVTTSAGVVRTWDVAKGEPAGPPFTRATSVRAEALAPDGLHVVTISGEGAVWVSDITTGHTVRLPLPGNRSGASLLYPGSGWPVVAADAPCSQPYQWTTMLWDVKHGVSLGVVPCHEGRARAASWSSSGLRLATGDYSAQLWNVRAGRPVGPPLKGRNQVAMLLHVSFSPDGSRLLTATIYPDGVQVWDASTGRAMGPRLCHDCSIHSASFGPDGKRVVTVSGTAQIWDLSTGQPVGLPLSQAGEVGQASFSPDGKRVLTASNDIARLWDADTGQPIGLPMRHESPVQLAAFSRDGRRITTVSGNTVRVWDVPGCRPSEAPLLAELAETISGYHIAGTGAPAPLSDRTSHLVSLRQRLGAAHGTDVDIPTLARWVLADPWTRTVSPFSGLTVRDYICGRLRNGAYDEARRAFGGHPLLRAGPNASAPAECATHGE
jgi:WD40 repeat protein